MKKIYVASSWRNLLHPGIVRALRRLGFDVYDYRHPEGDDSTGFGWDSIDEDWRQWTVEQYRSALQHPIAVAAHNADMNALDAADIVVLVMPSGRSACWEFGYGMARGKTAYVVAFEPMDPDLMFRGAGILADIQEFMFVFETLARADRAAEADE